MRDHAPTHRSKIDCKLIICAKAGNAVVGESAASVYDRKPQCTSPTDFCMSEVMLPILLTVQRKCYLSDEVNNELVREAV